MKLSRIQKIIRNTAIVIVLLAVLPLMFDMHFSAEKASMLFVDTIVTRLSCRSNASYTFLNTGSDTSTFYLPPYFFHLESPDLNPNSFPSLD